MSSDALTLGGAIETSCVRTLFDSAAKPEGGLIGYNGRTIAHARRAAPSDEGRVNCSNCQSSLVPGAKFCPNCGTKLAQACGACQHPNPIGAHYCEACGNPCAHQQLAQGDRRVVTVLFTDVSGFTAMSEKLDPQAVTEIVNRFFSVLTRPIYKYGGVVDKYIGDAIMALFGAPVAHEDDPERALAAAWEMQAAAKEFADNLEAKTGIRLKVRVGLNTGLVVAGAVGGEQKRDYTVLGETVNVASKMESNARPGWILVSEETYRLTQHCWDFVELEPVVIKGHSRAVRVFEPRSPRGPEQLSHRERPEFIGREVEMLKLELALDTALSGTPQVATLVGEAGIGKSRLAREFLARTAVPRGLRILRARCLSYQKDVSYSLVASLLSDWLKTGEHEIDHSSLDGWCRTQGAADPGREAELLGYFLSLPVRSAELKQLTPAALKNLATQTLQRYLLDPAQPTVLSLNDLQWADDASRAWLLALIETAGLPHVERLPFFILAQYRPEAEGLLSDEGTVATARLRIRPLSSEDGEQLIRSFLELQGPIEQAGFRSLLTEALKKAEGNPFYLCELIRSLTDAGVLVKEAGTWHVDPKANPSALPSTIQGVVASRIDRLSPGARHVAQVASVLGREFSRSLLAETSQSEGLGQALAELVEAELIHHRPRLPGMYAFNQALIQEVAYQGILVKVRRELHRRAGRLLEEKLAYQPAEQAQLLAYHFKQADDVPKAWHYLYLAGTHAQAFFDNSGAKAALIEALGLHERLAEAGDPSLCQVLTTLAEVMSTLGEYPEALQHLERALDRSTEASERAGIRRRMGGVHERLGAYEAAIASYQAGLSELAAGGPLRAGLLSAIGYAEFGLGRFEAAIAHCQEAMPALSGSEHLKDLGFCHSVSGISYARLGRYPQALEHHRKALECREACSDLLGVGSTCNNMFVVHYELGEFEQSRHFIEKAIEVFTRVGDQSWIAMGHNNLGTLLLEQDDLPGAETHFREALVICRRIGFASRVGGTLCNLGEACAKQGRFGEAIEHLQAGVKDLETLQNLEILPQAYQLLAQAYLDAGNVQDAWATVVKGLRLLKATKSVAQRGILYSLAGSVYSHARNDKAAIAWISRAIGVLQPLGNQLELGRAWTRLAYALWADGQRTHAAAAAVRARAIFKELGARYDLRTLESWIRSLNPIETVQA